MATVNTEVSSKQRVLVADDEEYIRDLVITALSFSGYEVTTAADGVNALNQIQKTLPDLIVLDVNMPGFNGSRCSAGFARVVTPLPWCSSLLEIRRRTS